MDSQETPSIEKHLRISRKLQTDDLDWELAAAIGLTAEEVEILEYFGDIEGQTIYYLRGSRNARISNCQARTRALCILLQRSGGASGGASVPAAFRSFPL